MAQRVQRQAFPSGAPEHPILFYAQDDRSPAEAPTDRRPRDKRRRYNPSVTENVRRIQRTARRGLLLVIASLLALSGPQTAGAHAVLVASEPTGGALLESAPTHVRLVLNEPIEASLSEISLIDAGRSVIVRTSPDPLDAAQGQMVADVPALAPGVYLVRWQAQSRLDAHGERGAFVFGVGVDPAASDLAFEAAQAEPPSPALIFRLFSIVSLFLLTGGVVLRRVIVSALAAVTAVPPNGLCSDLRRGAARWDGLALGLLIAAQTGLLATQLLPRWEVDGVAAVSVLWGTRFGLLWLAQSLVAVGLIVAAGGAVCRQATHPGDRSHLDCARVALLVAFALLASLSGHAAAADPAAVAVALNTLHLLAAAVWLGTLFHLAGGYLPATGRFAAPDRARLLATWLPRLSSLFVLCVLILAVTGLVAARLAVGSPGNLTGTLYGRTLIFKVGLFAGLILLGAFNVLIVRCR
ncbi:MAG TPA: copper resistance protein CopC, partial [Dehalococcoidia bacterium]|nr:copper resistance protein CopC [Dehalococcoidia bacterium]